MTLSPAAVWSPAMTKLSGTVMDEVVPEALRTCGPLAVTFDDESVMLIKLSTASIVVPNGIPIPVTGSPAKSAAVLAMPVTSADPLVRVAVKPEAARVSEPLAVTSGDESVMLVKLSMAWIVVPEGIPLPVTV